MHSSWMEVLNSLSLRIGCSIMLCIQCLKYVSGMSSILKWRNHSKVTASISYLLLLNWGSVFIIWNILSPCRAESVTERRSSHCWISWLVLDKGNHWRSTPVVAPDGWVQWALQNPSIYCRQLPLDGAAPKDFGIKCSQAVAYQTICGA